MIQAKKPRQKKCANPACGVKFTPMQLGQKVCGWQCGLAIAPASREKAQKAIKANERKEHAAQREKVKPKGAHAREAQALFNEWIRLRDANLPCVSCGRHHEGQYHAGHYRTTAAAPELRFEPLNVHKQCAPCNNHLSGNIVNYRAELINRIGPDKLEWLEGMHEPKRYTIEDLKAIKAEYRAKIKELRAAQEV